MSGLPLETRNYVREGIRLGAPKAAGELDKYESQRASVASQLEDQQIDGASHLTERVPRAERIQVRTDLIGKPHMEDQLSATSRRHTSELLGIQLKTVYIIIVNPFHVRRQHMLQSPPVNRAAGA